MTFAIGKASVASAQSSARSVSLSSTWSARVKMLLMRAVPKSSVIRPQSSANVVNSDICIVSSADMLVEPAVLLLEYCEKIDESSP